MTDLNSLYETLLESVGDAVIALDSQGRIIVWNAAAASLYGWKKDEVIGRAMRDVLPIVFDDPEETSERAVATVEETGIWRGIARQPRKDGTQVVVESTVHAYSGMAEDLHGLVAINRDVGEREKLRRAINRLEYLNRTLLRLPTIDLVFQTYIEQIREIIGFDRVELWLLDPEAWVVRVEKSFIKAGVPRNRGSSAPLKDTSLGLVRYTRQALIISDLSQRGSFKQRKLLLPNDRSCMLLPLLRSTELVGGILFASDEPGLYRPEDVELLASTTEQISLALLQIQLTDSLKAQVDENARMFLEAQEHARQLQELSRTLIQSQERERARLSREFHDEIGQSLTAIFLNIRSVLSMGDGLNSEAITALTDSVEITGRLVEQVRSISLDLHPKILEDLGFIPAIRWLVNRTAKLAQARANLALPDTYRPLQNEIEFEIFRITQEALTNILRHAAPGNIWLSLEQNDDLTRLVVSDDGAGFSGDYDAAAQLPANVFGFHSMFARAEFIGARLHISSSPGQGTVVSINYRPSAQA